MKALLIGLVIVFSGCMEGPTGPQGDRGAKGDKGENATVTVLGGTLSFSSATIYYSNSSETWYYWSIQDFRITESSLIQVYVRQNTTASWVPVPDWGFKSGRLEIYESPEVGHQSFVGWMYKIVLTQ